MPTYTIDQYADINGWAGIDALGSSRRAKGVALQREKLRDECTLRDANDEVIPFVAFKRELVEGKLEPDPNDPDKKIWVPAAHRSERAARRAARPARTRSPARRRLRAPRWNCTRGRRSVARAPRRRAAPPRTA